VISDLERWAEWNPLYPEAKGVVGFGERLTLTLALPGEPRETISPRIFDWAPDEAIHWNLSIRGGLVRTVRYLEIEAMGEESSFFSNGEIFDGLLSRFVPRRLRRAARQGFEQMGEAVRDRAEALWRSGNSAPK